MNRVETVSIGGYAFTLDDAACAKVRSYIDSLNLHYPASAGGDEIVDGIEERFAELLLERLAGNSVASESDVEAVIAILGVPESMDPEQDGQGPKKEEPGVSRRLYRDAETKMVGGVCGGLGAYFKLDPVIFRVAFVALSVILIFAKSEAWIWVPAVYLVLWLCIPQARTVSQRCAMRGESGTAEEIGRNISAGIGELGDAAHRIGNSDAWPVVWRVMCVCIGLVLLLIGISGLFAGIGLAIAGSIFKDLDILQGLNGWLSGSKVLSAMMADKWLVAILVAIYFIPFIGTSYLGLKMVFGFKSPKWKPGLTLFVLWLGLIVAAGVMVGVNAASPELLPDALFSF